MYDGKTLTIAEKRLKMIRYRKGYDGQLVDTVQFQLPIGLHPTQAIVTEFIEISVSGLMTINAGYAWDFASVPLTRKLSNWVQGKRSKVPSLVHDALCQLIRNGYLTMPDARELADKHFYKLLLDRGFWRIRAWLWLKAVRVGAKRHTQKPKRVYEAP